jgi:Putative zinc-finger
MDHVEALKRQTAEKYLLGELSEPETEEFEEHYFDCHECARDLEAGALFVDNATAVFRETEHVSAAATPQPLQPRRGIFDVFADLWRGPLAAVPAFAAVALAAFSGYQGLVIIPGLKHTVAEYASPHVVPEFPLLETTRGVQGASPVPADAITFNLRIDPTWSGDFPKYRFELNDSTGARLATWDAAAPESRRPIIIGLSRRSLEGGRHGISVSGIRADGSVQQDLATYAFTL